MPRTSPTLLAYAAPALVVALPTIPVYIHLPTLYGVDLGVGLATTAAIEFAKVKFGGGDHH